MKTMITLVVLVFLSFSTSLFAQTSDDRLKILEETLKKQEQALSELRKLIEELKAGVKQPQPTAPSAGAATNQTVAPVQMQQQVQELKEKVDQVVEAQKKTVPEHIQSRHRARG